MLYPKIRRNDAIYRMESRKNKGVCEMKNYDNDGCIRLIEAIIKQAVLDYGRAMKAHRRNPQDHIAAKTVRDCESFFLEDVDNYVLGESVAGPAALKSVKKQVYEKYSVCSAN